MTSKLLSVAEACERLSIGKSTLYEMIQRGDLAVLKIGSRTLITEEELTRFLAAAAAAGKRRVAATSNEEAA